MAILGNIRSKAGNTFVAVAVSFLVILLVGSDLGRSLAYLFGSRKDQIGTAAGEKISYSDYKSRMEEAIYHQFKGKGKSPTEEERMRLRDQVWREMIYHMLYVKETEQTGITVGTGELVDMVQGEHIHESIVALFKDPKTSSFDKQSLQSYLGSLAKNKQEEAAWYRFEKVLALTRSIEKLHQLMAQSSFVTELEAEQEAGRMREFCDVDYIYIPFTTVNNDLVAPTHQQLKDYMAAHRNSYKSSESKVIKYITFPIKPGENDSDDFQKDLNAITVQFATVADAYDFAKQHTDGDLADTSLACTADKLPDALAKIKHLKKGMVVGPVLQEGFHTLYKVVEVKQEKEVSSYEVVVIEKKINISDHTRNKRFRDVNRLVNRVKNLADLEALATKEHLMIQREEVGPSDGSIGAHAAAREVVRWLYNEAALGKVSKIFDLGDAYLLAVMVSQVKEGDLAPLDSASSSVYNEVYTKVLNQAKSKIILDKLAQCQATTLQGIADQYGGGIVVKSVEGLKHSGDNGKHLKKANVFVGRCFGLTPGSISGSIIDHEGVFVVCVKNKYKNETEAGTQNKVNKPLGQIERLMQYYYVMSSIEELAKVTDKRYKFE